MASKRRQRFLGSQRVDVPHIRSVESAVSADFDELISGLVTGPQGLVVRGFELNMVGAIGSAASGLQMLVASGMILHTTSRLSGTFYKVGDNVAPEILNPTINTNVIGSFAPGSLNYVGIEYERIADADTADTVYFWNPTSKDEFSSNVPLANILRYRIVITTSVWAANVLPICTVEVDVAGNVSEITDQRDMLGRLGKAGRNTPDPSYTYPWDNHSEGRTESPSSTTSPGTNPFRGGDKQLFNLKEILDAIFSRIKEIDGSSFWYQESGAGSLVQLRQDLGNTVVTGRGLIGHDNVTPGQINWDEDFSLTRISSRLRYRLLANPSPGTDITLQDGQAAYLNLVREVPILPNLIYINSSDIVASVGNVSWTSPLVAGDWIKLAVDGDTRYVQILSVDSASQVTLTIPWPYASTGAPGAASVYSFGVYESNPAPSTNRHIQIAAREDVPFNEDVFWLFLRDDGGGATPKVFVRFIGSELEQGEDVQIGDNVSRELLEYIGTPDEATSSPDYSSENYVTDGESLTSAIGSMDQAVWRKSGKLLGGGSLSVDIVDGASNVLLESRGTIPGNGASGLENNVTAVSNTIVPTNSGDVTSIEWYLRRFGASSFGNLFVEIRADNAGQPGALIATSNLIPTSTIATGIYAFYDFTFSSPVAISAGTTYHFVLTGDATYLANTAVSNVGVRYDSTAGNNGLVFVIGTGWVTSPTYINNIYGDAADTLNLSFTEPLYLETLGLPYSANSIPVLESPISFIGNQAAYVVPNLVSGGPDLTVIVDSIENVPKDSVVIARSTSLGVVTSGILIKNEEIVELDGVLAELNRRTNQLKLKRHELDLFKARIDTSDINQLDSSTIGRILGDLILSFSGAVINFQSGTILKEDDLTPLGLNFTPFAIPVGEYFWYGVSLNPADVTLDNRQEAQVQIDPAEMSDPSAIAAPRPVLSGDIKLGAIQIFNNAGNLEISDVFRLGSGSGSGSGVGDTTDIFERIKEKFQDSSFEFVHPIVFKIDKDEAVDEIASTGAYSAADKTYELDPAENFTSISLLSDGFIGQERDIDRVELLVFWRPGFVDENAVYEVTRDGINYQTVEMERVGNTELYRGVHFFADTEPDITVVEGDSNLGIVSSETLNNTTLQSIAQPFTIMTQTKIVELTELIPLVRSGNPQGNIFFEISRDNGGVPGEVIATSAFIPASSIPLIATQPMFPIGAVLPPGDYFFEMKTTQAYKDAFVFPGAAIQFNKIIGGPLGDALIFDGMSYTSLGAGFRFRLLGRALDLKTRITASVTGGQLQGIGNYYGFTAPVVTGIKSLEVFKFSGDDDITEFTVNKFKPNADLLKVYDVNTGLVYRYGAFTISGNKVIFSPGQFLSPGDQITLVFDQQVGGLYDNSDDNANLLSENRLGSEDPTLDKSIAGEGLLLRSTNGKLVEVYLFWNGTTHEIRLAEKP